MALPLESVPNFSEGRDAAVIKEIGRALAENAELLDIHTDADHNRTVFTLVGGDRELVDALVAGITVARDRIDLRKHPGVHPRIGAPAVVPLGPIRPGERTCSARARPRSSSHVASARRWGCRCVCTGRWEPGAGRRSFAAAGPRGFSRGSMPASSYPTSGPPGSAPARA